jgi:hypothetical protein
VIGVALGILALGVIAAAAFGVLLLLGGAVVGVGAWLRARPGRRKRVWHTVAVVVGLGLLASLAVSADFFAAAMLFCALIVAPVALAIDREAQS